MSLATISDRKSCTAEKTVHDLADTPSTVHQFQTQIQLQFLLIYVPFNIIIIIIMYPSYVMSFQDGQVKSWIHWTQKKTRVSTHTRNLLRYWERYKRFGLQDFFTFTFTSTFTEFINRWVITIYRVENWVSEITRDDNEYNIEMYKYTFCKTEAAILLKPDCGSLVPNDGGTGHTLCSRTLLGY